MSEGKIRVLIVDDHQVVRQGLRGFIDMQKDIEVVGEAEDGLKGVELAQTLRPDVVVMDLVMPRMDGVAAIKQITSAGLPIRVIALTSFTGENNVFPALAAGAVSYLLKDVSPSDLAEAIRAAARGETRLHPDIARKLVERVTRPKVETGKLEEITERELEVVRLVAQGANNREIAEKLFISEGTVKAHISNILNKLALSDRTQLAIYALKKGLGERN